jgi:formylglycine-generating enzyme required for sulfatase activity
MVLGLIGDPRLGDPRDPEWRKHGFVEVAAGRYAYQDGHQQIREPFFMGRYPVTNAQFDIFIEDGGYRDSRWWSDAGWTWRQQEAVTEPEYWRDDKFNVANQPLVGVSYGEAEAFCCWAGGDLPTEREWEAAARGPGGRDYPWGKHRVSTTCNTEEAGLGQTSPVGLFPRSRQKELGIEDLAGNVWEWCREETAEEADSGRGTGPRVLRGGVWDDGRGYARAGGRGGYNRGYRRDGNGFRVVCSSPIR